MQAGVQRKPPRLKIGGSMGNPRRNNGYRRNQARRQVLAEEDSCALCGKPVDKNLDMLPNRHGRNCQNLDCTGCTPHPMRGEVDEIVPVTKGGSPYKRSNLQLAHRDCNQRKLDHYPSAKALNW